MAAFSADTAVQRFPRWTTACPWSFTFISPSLFFVVNSASHFLADEGRGQGNGCEPGMVSSLALD